jgi:ubiquinone/menaquinone biosynthesis C-methylase UbiE
MTGKSADEMIAANRAAWGASAPHHRAAQSFAVLLNGFATPGYSCLDAVATERFGALQVAGKDVAQICCNNGREILSVRNMGAATCVGFDQSAAFLAQGRELAAAGNLDCRFVETDANRISTAFDEAFDLVFITIGVFGWMPDLKAFLGVAARLLRPGGALFVYEQHPIMNMFEPENEAPLLPMHSYFKAEPFEEKSPIVYDGSSGPDVNAHFWFVHTMGDVMTACIEHDLRIEHFREYPHNISSKEFDIYDAGPASLPQCYTLIARKEL